MTAFILCTPSAGLSSRSSSLAVTPLNSLRSMTSFVKPFRSCSSIVAPTLVSLSSAAQPETFSPTKMMDIGPFEREGDDKTSAPPQESSQEPPAQGSIEDTKLFVGNLSWDTTDSSLGTAFESYGTVIDARVIFDKYTGRSRGFGFVEYEDSVMADQALKGMNGFLVDGRAVRVDRATKRPRRTDGPST